MLHDTLDEKIRWNSAGVHTILILLNAMGALYFTKGVGGGCYLEPEINHRRTPLINSIKIMGILTQYQLSYFVSLFSRGQLLNEKNLLLQEQILSFKSRPHVKELHHPVMQTRIHTS